MSTASNDSTEEITAGHRPAPISNQEWNQQTTVDARNVLQTQLSTASGESPHPLQEQRSVISEFDSFRSSQRFHCLF